MLALNKSDIKDIANGHHNRYVASQDKDELLRELAERLLKASPDNEYIAIQTWDIKNALNDINDKLEDEELSEHTFDYINEKITNIEDYIGEIESVLEYYSE